MNRIWTISDEQARIIKRAQRQNKEFFYIGHYVTANDEYVLKPGTTNDLRRRRQEHNSSYRTTPNFPIKSGTFFEYDWFIPLSKYNTLRVEDNTKRRFINAGFGRYVNNDRFVFAEKPEAITIIVKKTYEIAL